jgi:chromosome segregation ATPase
VARERQLRLEAERTARELRIECDRFKAKIQESQQSFERIHVALEKMRHYRQQVDILQQEKELQAETYEGNLSRLREQITMLESQKNTLQMQLEEQRFRPPVDGDRERSQLLLRIARLERGNSQLMNNLTTQRQQFDTCLDKFATQVSQSQMEQKTLKRENSELQRRNAELKRKTNCLEGQLVSLSKDSGVGSINGIDNEEIEIYQRPSPLLPRHLPMSEKLQRRSLYTPAHCTPPSMGNLHGDDVEKMTVR